MRAVVYERFGGPEVLEVRELAAPGPRPGFARVRVQAAALNPKDLLLRLGKLRWLGAKPPHVPGYDFAGVLLDDADGLAAGAEVFGMIQSHRAGACAEIALVPVNELALKPARLSMEEAAALPLAGLTALQALRDELGLRAGQRLLINGASGGVGTLAVQLAKAMGATVLAACSAANAQLVRSLGADQVLDYRAEPPWAQRGLDAVFDVYGTLPWPKAKRCLVPSGRYCTTIPAPGAVVRGLLRRAGLHRAALVVVKSNRADLDELKARVESGALKPVIDSVHPLDEPARAHERLATRRARGKVVISLAQNEKRAASPTP